MAEIRDFWDYEPKTEEDLVHVLQECFHKQQYYIHAGDVLVSTNSWKDNENLEEEMISFMKLAKFSREFLPPHAFAVAESALENSRKRNTNVAIIPLGESGSGKSHNIQIILHYLARRSALAQNVQISKETILAINSILTSFCNAKTLICNNSTRCLTFYELCFDGNTDNLVGVNLQICLLEKFRVVNRIKNEGNFHIFHQFLDGLSPEQRNKYYLHGNHRYVQVNRDTRFENDEDNPLNKNIMCLSKLGFVQEEIDCIFTLLSAIILLGDLEFGLSKKREVAVVNGDVLQKVAILLGIPISSFLPLIIVQAKRSRGVSTTSPSVKAMIERDRLAVFLYETLVMWIESRINRKYSKSSQCSIFLLDAFGWENYNVNFFEQLCINITNETLQCAYTNIILNQYQMELEQEDIVLNESYKDYDQPGSMPFLFKPKGLLDVLDMTTMDSKGKMNDHTLLKKMNATFKNDSCYLANNSDFTGFLIQHFIGKVSYDINGFLTKSLCLVNANVLAFLKDSKNKVLSIMVQERLSRENSLNRDASPRYASVKTRSFHENEWLKTDVFLLCRKKKKNKLVPYKSSNPCILATTLTSVINRLLSSKVHFIRCIKSNNFMEPNNFDYERVLQQVRWSGLLPTVQSRPSYLKLKLTFSEFISRYKVIFFHLSRPIEPSSAIFLSVLSKAYDASQFRIGKSKIFMSSSLVHELGRKLQEIFSQVVFVQKGYFCKS